MLLKSLFARKRKIDAGPKLRRIMDMTVPNRPVCNETRSENRYNRSLPALILPWVKDEPVLKSPEIGILQDISDSGLSLIFLNAPTHPTYLLSFLLVNDEMPELFHFIGEVRAVRKFAPGMSTVGFVITGCADVADFSVVTRASFEGIVHETLLAE